MFGFKVVYHVLSEDNSLMGFSTDSTFDIEVYDHNVLDKCGKKSEYVATIFEGGRKA